MLKKLGFLLIFSTVLFIAIYWFYLGDEPALQSQSHLQSKMERSLKGEDNIEHGKQLIITQMIDQMSIDEKIGQLIFAGISGTTITAETKSLIHNYHVGGIILFANNLETPEQSLKLLNQIKAENSQNNVPIFLGVDQEGGRVERLPNLHKLPSSQEIAAKDQKEISYDIGQLLAKQVASFGFNLNFAPVLDVNSNPNNPVIGDRSFGDRAEIVSEFGIQTMKGLQSENIITVVKHFPGHGDTDVDSHLELPKVNKNLEELHDLEFIPFKAAIEEGADIVMTAHILLPQIDPEYPSSMSKKVVTEILREQLEFDGVIITDDMTMQAITNHFEIGEAAVNAIKAGTDIILMAHNYDGLLSVVQSLQVAVANGEITEERLNESVRRVIQLKQDYGLADEQVEFIDIESLRKSMEEVLHE